MAWLIGWSAARFCKYILGAMPSLLSLEPFHLIFAYLGIQLASFLNAVSTLKHIYLQRSRTCHATLQLPLPLFNEWSVLQMMVLTSMIVEP